MDLSYIELIQPTELYNILNEKFKYPAASDTNCLLLLDARQTHEYNESHVVTAKKAPKDGNGAFCVPYNAELECKQHVIVYDGTTDSLNSLDTPAIKCAFLMKEMGSRNPVKILCGGYEKFSAVYPFLRTQKILWLPQELDDVKTYPVEIIPEVLYMGDWRHGNAPYIQKDLKIKAHVNCTTETAEFTFEDKHSLMNVPISDTEDSDLSQYLQNVCAFIDMHKEKGAVLVYSDLGLSRAVAICIAYLMHTSRISLEESYAHIRKNHQFACPNTNFLDQLQKWHKEMIESTEAEP